MAKVVLLLVLMAGGWAASIPTSDSFSRTNWLVLAVGHPQSNRPLALSQIEQLLESKIEDQVIAREINERGIAFKPDAAVLENLLKRGAGALTQRALLQQAERAAYAEYANEKPDAAKRLALGREFLRQYPQSTYAAEVVAGNRKAMLEIFAAAFQSFSANPDAASLDRVLTLGRELLSQQPDRATIVQVTSQLALATGRGMLGNFYSDLEQSRAYANQALRLLEDPTPPPEMDRPSYDKLRTNSLSLLYQTQGLYLLRQPVPDAEQAISFLTKAAELPGGPSANDPNTYWLRALARDLIYQKLSADYQALPKNQRLSRPGQTLCARITPLANQLLDDYTRVISLSNAAASNAAAARQLSEEAVAALKTLLTNDRPCLGGRIELIDEWPSEEKRFALVIGVEDYLDQRVGKFNSATAAARAVADVLVQHAGFRPEQVVLLTTGAARERQPLRNLILQQLAELPRRVAEDGLLLIYFAGHSVESGGKPYLLPADALLGNEALLAETALSAERVKELIRASGVGQVLLICESFRQQPVSEVFARGLTFDLSKREVTAFVTLLAASVGQRAYESAAKKQGYFTAAFVEALQGKAANRNREVTLDELIRYLQTTVPQEAQRDLGANAQQRPLAVSEGYQADELALAKGDAAARATAKAAPAELARNARTLFIRSKTVYLNPALLEAELLKQADFQALGLKVVKDLKAADLIVEVTLPFLTWMWNFTITHQAGNTALATGKIREITAGAAAPKLARELIARLQAVRSGAAQK